MRILLYLISCFMLAIVASFAQTGINTVMPKASLDVQKSNNPAFTDGIIPPRVTCTELLNKPYSTEQQGALVYVTDADCTVLGDANEFYNPASPKWPIRLIGKSGYYTFNGKEWVSVELDGLSTRYIDEKKPEATAEKKILQVGQKVIATEKVKKEQIENITYFHFCKIYFSISKDPNHTIQAYFFQPEGGTLVNGKYTRLYVAPNLAIGGISRNNLTIKSIVPNANINWIEFDANSPAKDFYLTVESKDKTTEYVYRITFTVYISTSAADDFDVLFTTIVERLL